MTSISEVMESNKMRCAIVNAFILFFLVCFLNVVAAQSAQALEIYYGSRSGAGGLCPNGNVDASCICTEDKVLGLIYRERCVSIPGAFQIQDGSESTEIDGSGSGNPFEELLKKINKAPSSTFAYPRVRFAYYLWGSGVAVTHYGPGECSFVKALRHCARLTNGGERGNDLAGDTSGRSEGGIPLRLCVFEDPWDFKDTNGQFSPFHHNTPPAEAALITSSMKKNTFGDEEWLGSDSRVVSGWDNFWSFVTGGSYNNNVTTIVGCAPIPLAPFPPPYCDDCDVLPNVPDPDVKLKENTTFENTEILVTFSKYDFNDQKRMFELKVDRTVTMSAGQCEDHEGDQYCAAYCSQGRQLCFIKQEEDSYRVLRYIDRPDYMPLPSVADATEDADFPKIEVFFGDDPYEESAVLSINEEGQECATLLGVEFCAERECYQWNETTGECVLRSSQVCLKGYEPEVFDVPGYHPSKGVLIDINTQNYSNKNSFDSGKYYFDFKEYMIQEGVNGFPPNTFHRPFTAEELGLCVGGTWRWPEDANSVYTTPGTVTVNVDPSCKRVRTRLWGGGAAGGWQNGCHDLTCDFAGGAGGFVRAEFDLEEGDDVKVVIGAGGSSGAGGNFTSNAGGASSIRINGTDIITALGGNRANGGGTSFQNVRNMTIVKRVTGQTTNGLPTAAVAVAGGLAEESTLQPASDCQTGSGVGPRAPHGGGGCSKDDSPGRIGLGGHGASSFECLVFADLEPSEQPMPALE